MGNVHVIVQTCLDPGVETGKIKNTSIQKLYGGIFI